ncbi:hypothetical protein GCM10027067_28130 [Pseudactinotalea suaedae]
MRPPNLPHVLTAQEYGYQALRELARTGEIERVRRGAYAPPGPATPVWQRARQQNLARCVAVSKRLTGLYAFSHATAANLFGWECPVDPGTVEIVQIPKPSSARQSDIRRHARPALTPSDIVEVAGLPVVREDTTIIDCARSLSPMNALITVDSALKALAHVDKFRREDSLARQAVLLDHLTALLQGIGPGRNVVRAREVLTYANGLAGSARESQLRWLALSIGLPEPVLEWEQSIDGATYFSDLAWLKSAEDWSSRAVTFEYDGVDKYGNEPQSIVRAIAAEKVREDAIASTGVAVHRVMKDRLKDRRAAAMWMLSKFPPSTRVALTPRPLLQGPTILLPRTTSR